MSSNTSRNYGRFHYLDYTHLSNQYIALRPLVRTRCTILRDDALASKATPKYTNYSTHSKQVSPNFTYFPA